MTGDNAFLDRFMATPSMPTASQEHSPIQTATGHALWRPSRRHAASKAIPPLPTSFHLTSEAINVRLTQGMCKQASKATALSSMKSLNHRFEALGEHFQANHLNEDGTLKYKSLTAHLLCPPLWIAGRRTENQSWPRFTQALEGRLCRISFLTEPLCRSKSSSRAYLAGTIAIRLSPWPKPKTQNGPFPALALAAISEWLISLHEQESIPNSPDFKTFESSRTSQPKNQMASQQDAWFDSPHGYVSLPTIPAKTESDGLIST